jgi:hypothetical protein
MTRSIAPAFCFVFVFASLRPAQLSAQTPSDLSGTWVLNRQLSQFPSELGFSADFLGALGPGAGPVSGGRGGGRGGGRRGGGGGGTGGGLSAPKIVRETEEDSQRVLLLTDEVRNPFEHVTITETSTDVTITPDRAPARTFHPNGKDERIAVGRVMATVNAHWDGSRLIVVYKAETGRELHYAYSLNANPTQLIVDVEFVEQVGGDKVRRIYEPAASPDTRATATAPPVAAPNPTPATAASPAAPAAASIDQRPDAALKGLTKLGVVVEDLNGDAAACSLTRDSLETMVSKHLTDAGFRVVRNSDDDTYMYVNINTTKVSTGLCVSRYDVTLYSHAAAPLSHTASPVLLQVELLHKGGIAGGAPAAHADGVVKSVLEYVDQFSTRIRNAAK